MPTPLKYKPGDRVNSWTVINYDYEQHSYRVMCQCGATLMRRAYVLAKHKCCHRCRQNYKSETSLIGERFGMRVILAELEKNQFGNRVFLVDCDCGHEHVLDFWSIKKAAGKSCLIKPDA